MNGRDIPIELTAEQEARFWSRVEKTPTCWRWKGHLAEFGYGQIKIGGRTLKAHRISWRLLRGQLPEGWTLDHLCRNPTCVNPEHLEIVSNKENILRGTSPTAKNASKTHCVNGHTYTIENTTVSRQNRRVCRTCYLANLEHRKVMRRANG